MRQVLELPQGAHDHHSKRAVAHRAAEGDSHGDFRRGFVADEIGNPQNRRDKPGETRGKCMARTAGRMEHELEGNAGEIETGRHRQWDQDRVALAEFLAADESEQLPAEDHCQDDHDRPGPRGE